MPDQEFKLLITGDATSGVAATQQMGDATKRLKVDCSDLSDETKRSLNLLPQQTTATKQLGEVTGEAGEKFGSGGREVRRLANELGNMAGVADAGALTMGKMGLAVFAAAEALQFLMASWKNVQEGIHGEIDLQVHAPVETIIQMAKSLDDYAAARKRATEANNTPEANTGREIKELENKLKLLKDVLKAEEAEALAALAAKKEQMSPQQYAAEENRIKTAFGEKATAADEKTQRDKIAAQEKEAAAMEADAAKKKAQGDTLTSEKATDAQETAKKNAAAAQKQLEAVQAVLDLIKRYNDPASRTDDGIYSGVTGKAQEAQDWFKLAGLAGADRDIGDLQKDYEHQKSQAQVAINQGAQAEQKQKKGTELETAAGKESGDAENLRALIRQELNELAAQSLTTKTTEALGHAGAALGQEHAAEGNNTAQGARDAAAAHASAVSAVNEIAALLTQGGLPSESINALREAIKHLQEEDRKLAAQIRQNGFNGK